MLRQAWWHIISCQLLQHIVFLIAHYKASEAFVVLKRLSYLFSHSYIIQLPFGTIILDSQAPLVWSFLTISEALSPSKYLFATLRLAWDIPQLLLLRLVQSLTFQTSGRSTVGTKFDIPNIWWDNNKYKANLILTLWAYSSFLFSLFSLFWRMDRREEPSSLFQIKLAKEFDYVSEV